MCIAHSNVLVCTVYKPIILLYATDFENYIDSLNTTLYDSVN